MNENCEYKNAAWELYKQPAYKAANNLMTNEEILSLYEMANKAGNTLPSDYIFKNKCFSHTLKHLKEQE